MPFSPPFCPNKACSFNKSPISRFAWSHGRYHSASLNRWVPRFLCSGCRRTFSQTTFRFSYRQKKPGVDASLMNLMCNGVSLRGAARLLDINRKTVFRKLRRIARHSRRLHQARLASASISGIFQLDEMEAFETNRYKPVSIPIVIEKRSYFVVATATAPLRRKGRMTPAQLRKRAHLERLHGRRRSRSDVAVTRCLAALARHALPPVVLESDRKPTYGALCRRLLHKDVLHRTHDSRARRDRANPLFPINHTNAMLRYCLARLRRRTWCVTRSRRWLQHALDLYAAWFNYCRGITIKTQVSPAQSIGLAVRKLKPAEWLSWRQDWHNAGRILHAALRRN